MKITSISKIALSLTLSLSLFSFANAKEGMSEKTDKKAKASVASFDASLYKVANTNKVKLAIDRIPETSVSLVLKDGNGSVIYEESLQRSNDTPYRRVFDLGDMADGTYYFEMYNKDRKIVKKLEIATSNNKVVVL